MQRTIRIKKERKKEKNIYKNNSECTYVYEGVSKSFRTGNLERVQQMVQLPAIKCGCIATL
jgi:hypothetical protein